MTNLSCTLHYNINQDIRESDSVPLLICLSTTTTMHFLLFPCVHLYNNKTHESQSKSKQRKETRRYNRENLEIHRPAHRKNPTNIKVSLLFAKLFCIHL